MVKEINKLVEMLRDISDKTMKGIEQTIDSGEEIGTAMNLVTDMASEMNSLLDSANRMA